MGWNDRVLDNSFTQNETCPECGKIFECTYTDQIPGFRFGEPKVCPYCGKVITTSLEYEFTTRRI